MQSAEITKQFEIDYQDAAKILGFRPECMWESAFINDYRDDGQPEEWAFDQDSTLVEKRNQIVNEASFKLVKIETGELKLVGMFHHDGFMEAEENVSLKASTYMGILEEMGWNFDEFYQDTAESLEIDYDMARSISNTLMVELAIDQNGKSSYAIEDHWDPQPTGNDEGTLEDIMAILTG